MVTSIGYKLSAGFGCRKPASRRTVGYGIVRKKKLGLLSNFVGHVLVNRISSMISSSGSYIISDRGRKSVGKNKKTTQFIIW